jgi:hypothetical protein
MTRLPNAVNIWTCSAIDGELFTLLFAENDDRSGPDDLKPD